MTLTACLFRTLCDPRALLSSPTLHPLPGKPGDAEGDREEDESDEHVRAAARVVQVVVEGVRGREDGHPGDQHCAGRGLIPVERVRGGRVDRNEEDEPERHGIVVGTADQLDCK